MFFAASKIVWAILRPETLFMLLIAGGLFALLRDRRRLGFGLAGGGLFCFALLAALPLGDLLIRPLETRYPANPPVTDVRGIIVLGGGEQISRSAYWRMPLVNGAGDRFLSAIALARRFPEAQVVFAGGSGALRGTGRGGDVTHPADLCLGRHLAGATAAGGEIAQHGGKRPFFPRPGRGRHGGDLVAGDQRRAYAARHADVLRRRLERAHRLADRFPQPVVLAALAPPRLAAAGESRHPRFRRA